MLTIDEIRQGLKDNGYIPNDDICYAVFAALSLNKPVLIEGDPIISNAVSKLNLCQHFASIKSIRADAANCVWNCYGRYVTS